MTPFPPVSSVLGRISAFGWVARYNIGELYHWAVSLITRIPKTDASPAKMIIVI